MTQNIRVINQLEGSRTTSLKQVFPDPHPAIALISIGERSTEGLPHAKNGRLSRSVYAQLIRKLEAAKARVLCLDVFFEKPRPGDDEEFKDALSNPGALS